MFNFWVNGQPGYQTFHGVQGTESACAWFASATEQRTFESFGAMGSFAERESVFAKEEPELGDVSAEPLGEVMDLGLARWATFESSQAIGLFAKRESVSVKGEP